MYSSIKYLLLVLFLGIQFGFAQIPPTLDCVERSGTNDSLTWNISGSCFTFVLYRSTTKAGPYAIQDTLMVPLGGISKSHTGIDLWYYLICLTGGNTSDTVDNIDPQTPPIESVNVNATNDSVRINWAVSPSPETHGYIIYIDSAMATQEIATVTGRFNTQYIHGDSQPGNQSEKYFVNAVDSCGNRGVISVVPNGPHHTIFLENVILDSCSQTASLSWNAYENWVGGVLEYQVLLSVNGDTFSVVSPAGLAALTYTYIGLSAGDTLCFKIRAIGPSGYTATSNTRCLEFDVVQPAAFTYLNSVNVSQNSSVILRWFADSTADIKRFSVERSTDNVNFSEVYSMLPPAQLAAELSYKDQNNFPNEQAYYYRILTYDLCDNFHISNTVRTIFVKGDAQNLVNIIEWNAIYLGSTPYDSAHFEIFRKVNGLWSSSPIAVVQISQPLEYADSIQTTISNTGKYDYLVVGNYRETINNTYNLTYSNILVLSQPWQISCPNAFMPNAIVPINREFKCVTTFVDIFTYQLQVYNRGGQLLFETQDKDVGWDGTYKDKDLPQGLYVYKLNIVDKDGFPFDDKGTILIIR